MFAVEIRELLIILKVPIYVYTNPVLFQFLRNIAFVLRAARDIKKRSRLTEKRKISLAWL